jgi:hypothetical protein
VSVNKIKEYGNALNCQVLLATAIPVIVCIMTVPSQKNSFILLSTREHKVQYHNTTTYFRCTTFQQDFVLSQLLQSLYILSQVSRLLYKKISPRAFCRYTSAPTRNSAWWLPAVYLLS